MDFLRVSYLFRPQESSRRTQTMYKVRRRQGEGSSPSLCAWTVCFILLICATRTVNGIISFPNHINCTYASSRCTSCSTSGSPCESGQEIYHLFPSSCNPLFSTLAGSISYSESHPDRTAPSFRFGSSGNAPSINVDSRSIPPETALERGYTISIYYRAEETQGNLYQIELGSTTIILQYVSNTLMLTAGGSTSIPLPSSAAATGTWKSVLVTLDEALPGSGAGDSMTPLTPMEMLAINSIYSDGVYIDTTMTSDVLFPNTISSIKAGSGFQGYLQDFAIYSPLLDVSANRVTIPPEASLLSQCLCAPNSTISSDENDCIDLNGASTSRIDLNSREPFEYAADVSTVTSEMTLWSSGTGDSPVTFYIGLSGVLALSKIFISFNSDLPTKSTLQFYDDSSSSWKDLQYFAGNCMTSFQIQANATFTSSTDTLCIQNTGKTLTFLVAGTEGNVRPEPGQGGTPLENMFQASQVRLVMDGVGQGGQFSILDFQICPNYCFNLVEDCNEPCVPLVSPTTSSSVVADMFTSLQQATTTSTMVQQATTTSTMVQQATTTSTMVQQATTTSTMVQQATTTSTMVQQATTTSTMVQQATTSAEQIPVTSAEAQVPLTTMVQMFSSTTSLVHIPMVSTTQQLTTSAVQLPTTSANQATSSSNVESPTSSSMLQQTTTIVQQQPSTTSAQIQQPTTSIVQLPTTSSAVQQPSTTSAVQQQPSTSSVAQQASTSSAVQLPTTTSSAVQLPTTTSSAVQQPSTSSAVQQPSTSSAVQQQPSTSTVVQQPTTTSTVVQQPTTTSTVVQLPTTTSSAVQQPSTSSAVQQQPSTSTVVQQPTTTSTVVQQPTTTSSAVQQPSTSSIVEQLTTSSVAQLPSTSSAVQQQSSTSSVVQQATTSSAAQLPISSTVVQQPTTTSSAIQLPSTSSVVQLPSTSSAVQLPSTSSAVQLPSTSSAVQLPSTSSVVQQPITTPSAAQVLSTSSIIQQQPSTSTVAVQPTTTSVLQQPSTSSAVQQPTTSSVAVEVPLTSSVIQQQPSTSSAAQLPTSSPVQSTTTSIPQQTTATSSSIVQLPTTSTTIQLSTSVPVIQQPGTSTLVVVQPSSTVVQQPSSSTPADLQPSTTPIPQLGSSTFAIQQPSTTAQQPSTTTQAIQQPTMTVTELQLSSSVLPITSSLMQQETSSLGQEIATSTPQSVMVATSAVLLSTSLSDQQPTTSSVIPQMTSTTTSLQIQPSVTSSVQSPLSTSSFTQQSSSSVFQLPPTSLVQTQSLSSAITSSTTSVEQLPPTSSASVPTSEVQPPTTSTIQLPTTSSIPVVASTSLPQEQATSTSLLFPTSTVAGIVSQTTPVVITSSAAASQIQPTNTVTESSPLVLPVTSLTSSAAVTSTTQEPVSSLMLSSTPIVELTSLVTTSSSPELSSTPVVVVSSGLSSFGASSVAGTFTGILQPSSTPVEANTLSFSSSVISTSSVGVPITTTASTTPESSQSIAVEPTPTLSSAIEGVETTALTSSLVMPTPTGALVTASELVTNTIDTVIVDTASVVITSAVSGEQQVPSASSFNVEPTATSSVSPTASPLSIIPVVSPSVSAQSFSESTTPSLPSVSLTATTSLGEEGTTSLSASIVSLSPSTEELQASDTIIPSTIVISITSSPASLQPTSQVVELTQSVLSPTPAPSSSVVIQTSELPEETELPSLSSLTQGVEVTSSMIEPNVSVVQPTTSLLEEVTSLFLTRSIFPTPAPTISTTPEPSSSTSFNFVSEDIATVTVTPSPTISNETSEAVTGTPELVITSLSQIVITPLSLSVARRVVSTTNVMVVLSETSIPAPTLTSIVNTLSPTDGVAPTLTMTPESTTASISEEISESLNTTFNPMPTPTLSISSTPGPSSSIVELETNASTTFLIETPATPVPTPVATPSVEENVTSIVTSSVFETQNVSETVVPETVSLASSMSLPSSLSMVPMVSVTSLIQPSPVTVSPSLESVTQMLNFSEATPEVSSPSVNETGFPEETFSLGTPVLTPTPAVESDNESVIASTPSASTEPLTTVLSMTSARMVTMSSQVVPSVMPTPSTTEFLFESNSSTVTVFESSMTVLTITPTFTEEINATSELPFSTSLIESSTQPPSVTASLVSENVTSTIALSSTGEINATESAISISVEITPTTSTPSMFVSVSPSLSAAPTPSVTSVEVGSGDMMTDLFPFSTPEETSSMVQTVTSVETSSTPLASISPSVSLTPSLSFSTAGPSISTPSFSTAVTTSSIQVSSSPAVTTTLAMTSSIVSPTPSPTPSITNIPRPSPYAPISIGIEGLGFILDEGVQSVDDEGLKYTIGFGEFFSKNESENSGYLTASFGPFTARSESFDLTPNPVSRVSGNVSSDMVWPEDPVVHLALQVRDDSFNTNLTNTSVEVLVSLVQTPSNNMSYTCTVMAASGICTVKINIPGSWFDNNEQTVVIEIERGDSFSIQLMPSTQSLNNTTVMYIPRQAIQAGEEVQIPVYSTYNNLLASYSFDCTLNGPATIKDVSGSFNWSVLPIFSPDDENRLSITGFRNYDKTSSVNTSFEPDFLFNLTLIIADQSAVNERSNVSIRCDSFKRILTTNIEIESSFVEAVDRYNAMGSDTGFLVLETRRYVDIFAHVQQNELLNVARLTSETILTKLNIWGFTVDGQIESVTEDLSCMSQDENVTNVYSNCSHAFFDGTELYGANEVYIIITLSSQDVLVTELPLRVWSPSRDVLLLPEDDSLNLIQTMATCSNVTTRYQRTTVSIMTSISTSQDGPENYIFVTSLLSSYLRSNSSIVSVSQDGIVQGESTGAAVIYVSTLGDISSHEVEIFVTDDPVQVNFIDTFPFSEIDISIPSVIMDMQDASVTLVQEFQFVGSKLNVVAVAVFSDNQTMVLSDDDGLEIVVEEEEGESILADTLTGEYIITRPLNGINVRASWMDRECNQTIKEGRITMTNTSETERPELVLTASSENLTSPGDLAYYFGTPAWLMLDVSLDYRESGVTREITEFTDVQFNVSQGSEQLVEVNSSSWIVTTSDMMESGTATITATFPYENATLNASLNINVIHSTSFSLNLTPYDGPENITLDDLSQIGQSGVYQKALVKANIRFSDESQIDVTNSVNLSIAQDPNMAVSVSDLEERVLRVNDGIAPQTISLQATFQNIPSQTLHINVSSIPVKVQNIDKIMIHDVNGDNQRYIDCRVTLTDGTKLEHTFDENGSPIYADLITLSSSDEDTFFSINEGILTMLANHHSAVTLTATSNNVTSSMEFYTNLKPEVGEIDLGKSDGPPLSSVEMEEEFSVPVVVNSANVPMGVYELELLFYPADKLAFMSATQGDNWMNGSIVSIENEPGRVTIGGVLNTGAMGALEELAVVNFTALESGSVNFNVTVKYLSEANVNLTNITIPNSKPTASQIQVVIDSNNARRKRDSEGVDRYEQYQDAEEMYSRSIVRRQTDSSTPKLIGDANGDGVLDLRDAYLLQVYLASEVYNFTSEVGMDVQRVTESNIIGEVSLDQIYAAERASLEINFIVTNTNVEFDYNINSGQCEMTVSGLVVTSTGDLLPTIPSFVNIILEFSSSNSTFQNQFDSSNFTIGSASSSVVAQNAYGGIVVAEKSNSSSEFIVQAVHEFTLDFELKVYLVVLSTSQADGNDINNVDVGGFETELVDTLNIANPTAMCTPPTTPEPTTVMMTTETTTEETTQMSTTEETTEVSTTEETTQPTTEDTTEVSTTEETTQPTTEETTQMSTTEETTEVSTTEETTQPTTEETTEVSTTEETTQPTTEETTQMSTTEETTEVSTTEETTQPTTEETTEVSTTEETTQPTTEDTTEVSTTEETTQPTTEETTQMSTTEETTEVSTTEETTQPTTEETTEVSTTEETTQPTTEETTQMSTTEETTEVSTTEETTQPTTEETTEVSTTEETTQPTTEETTQMSTTEETTEVSTTEETTQPTTEETTQMSTTEETTEVSTTEETTQPTTEETTEVSTTEETTQPTTEETTEVSTTEETTQPTTEETTEVSTTEETTQPTTEETTEVSTTEETTQPTTEETTEVSTTEETTQMTTTEETTQMSTTEETTQMSTTEETTQMSTTEETTEETTEVSTTEEPTQPTINNTTPGPITSDVAQTPESTDAVSTTEMPSIDATSSSSITGIIAGVMAVIVIGLLSIILIIIVIWFVKRRRKKRGVYAPGLANGRSNKNTSRAFWLQEEGKVEMSPIDIVPLEPNMYDTQYSESTMEIIPNHRAVYTGTEEDTFMSGSSVKPLIRQPPQPGRQLMPHRGKQTMSSYTGTATEPPPPYQTTTGTTCKTGSDSSPYEVEDDELIDLHFNEDYSTQPYLSLGLTPLSQLSPDNTSGSDNGFFPSMPPPVGPSVFNINSPPGIPVDSPFNISGGGHGSSSGSMIMPNAFPSATEPRRSSAPKRPAKHDNPLSQGYMIRLEPVHEQSESLDDSFSDPYGGYRYSGENDIQNGFGSSSSNSESGETTDLLFPSADTTDYMPSRGPMHLKRQKGKRLKSGTRRFEDGASQENGLIFSNQGVENGFDNHGLHHASPRQEAKYRRQKAREQELAKQKAILRQKAVDDERRKLALQEQRAAQIAQDYGSTRQREDGLYFQPPGIPRADSGAVLRQAMKLEAQQQLISELNSQGTSPGTKHSQELQVQGRRPSIDNRPEHVQMHVYDQVTTL